tara:strand:- start:4854 stop:5234 length:381 start_codon:yes stop_codon:yes gene_type:complete
MKLTDFLKAINYTKKPLLDGEALEKDYAPFVVNRCLSYFPDTLFHANTMNHMCSMDKKMHFDYLRGAVRKRNRFSPWVKKEKQPEIDAIKIIFGFSNSKAKEALRVLSQEDIDSIVDAAEKLENPK